jgi:hypothetical protein
LSLHPFLFYLFFTTLSSAFVYFSHFLFLLPLLSIPHLQYTSFPYSVFFPNFLFLYPVIHFLVVALHLLFTFIFCSPFLIPNSSFLSAAFPFTSVVYLQCFVILFLLCFHCILSLFSNLCSITLSFYLFSTFSFPVGTASVSLIFFRIFSFLSQSTINPIPSPTSAILLSILSDNTLAIS